MGGEVQMSTPRFSKPFKRNGSICRWVILDDKKMLQYFHRIADKWLPMTEDGKLVVKPLRRSRR